jgi:histidine triad (HIT) family protein
MAKEGACAGPDRARLRAPVTRGNILAASTAASPRRRALSDNDCLFCKIGRGEVPANRLMENDDVVAFRDINPQAPVHILIIPREHIRSLGELDESQVHLVGKLHLAARELAKRAGLENQGWRIVTNVGADAGQTVQHLHLHLLGGRTMHWPPG